MGRPKKKDKVQVMIRPDRDLLKRFDKKCEKRSRNIVLCTLMDGFVSGKFVINWSSENEPGDGLTGRV